MAYSNPLDPATPAFDGDAGLGDDQLRELKAALKERVESFFEDINGDPWKPRSAALGLVVSSRILHTQFAPRDNATSYSRGVAAISPNAHTQSVFYGSLAFDPGITIKTATCKLSAAVGSNAGVNVDVYRVYEGGGPDLLGSIATSGSGSGIQTVSLDITRVTVAGDLYTFVVILNTLTSPNVNDAQFYWAQISTI